ncbi:MAG TPA: GAF domain-containing protein [Thermoleophilaceae bacterium]
MGRWPWVALEATTDKRERARELVRAHRRVLEGWREDASVRQVIRESWRRSAAAGVDPAVRSAPLRLSDGEIRERLEHGPLSLAPPVLRQLREEVQAEDEQIALLCDLDGTILWIDGDPRVLDRANSIHLSPGAQWSEQAVGTNAMGTALAVDHPVQIFAAEHFAEQVHPWTCAAAPLHDPDSGEPIGVIDLSGGLSTAHPHSLALVATAARVIESLALRERRGRDERLRQRFGAEVGGGRARALVSQAGRIVDATSNAWVGQRLQLPAGGGPLSWRGGAFVAEPVADGAGYLLVGASGRAVSSTRVEALGRSRIRVLIGGKWISLSPRHSELFLTLQLRPHGMTAEELTLAVWGERAKPINARAELSRLRRVLGSQLEAAPYRLHGEVRTDFDEVGQLIAQGRLGDALDRYPGPLLPRSEVPIVCEARQLLDEGLRGALLARRSPGLLERWLTNPSGRNDASACHELLTLLPEGDARRAAALSHLRRITAERGRC